MMVLYSDFIIRTGKLLLYKTNKTIQDVLLLENLVQSDNGKQ